LLFCAGGSVKTDQLSSVFCYHERAIVQMPPKETAGKRYFIPSITSYLWTSQPEIYVKATEDSTPVTIKGDYDQLDLVINKGDEIQRTVETAQVNHLRRYV